MAGEKVSHHDKLPTPPPNSLNETDTSLPTMMGKVRYRKRWRFTCPDCGKVFWTFKHGGMKTDCLLKAPEEIGPILGLPISLMQKMAKEKAVPHVTINGQPLFHLPVLEAWIKTQLLEMSELNRWRKAPHSRHEYMVHGPTCPCRRCVRIRERESRLNTQKSDSPQPTDKQ